MKPLKNIFHVFCLVCFSLICMPGILLSKPQWQPMLNQDGTEQPNLFHNEFPDSKQINSIIDRIAYCETDQTKYLKKKDTLIQEADTLQYNTPYDDSDSESETPPQEWKVDFYKFGSPLDDDKKITIEVEIFLDYELLFAGQLSPQNINDTLNKFGDKHKGHKTLELILLNRKFDNWLIHLDDESLYHQSEEVSLVFFPGEKTHYMIELSEAEKQVKDHHVYYIAMSGWQINPRKILNLLDTTALIVDDPFLVYFHGPFNTVITIDHNSSVDERGELRSRITDTTPPPDNPSTELRQLQNEINQLFSESNYLPRLKLYLILSESTYNVLKNDFIIRLLEIMNQQMDSMELDDYQVTFVTDFDIDAVGFEYEKVQIYFKNLYNPN